MSAPTPWPWRMERIDSWEGEVLSSSLHTIWSDTPFLLTLVARTCFAPASEANARLIAAAPEMLAALKEVREACMAAMRVIARHELVLDFLDEAKEAGVTEGFGVRAKHVIAKAEGEVPR